MGLIIFFLGCLYGLYRMGVLADLFGNKKSTAEAGTGVNSIIHQYQDISRKKLFFITLAVVLFAGLLSLTQNQSRYVPLPSEKQRAVALSDLER